MVPNVPGVLRLPALIGAAAAALGTAAAFHYAQLGLTLAHYDAKAHLVVSRRILDSLTPGWEQVGAVWLPLPHLLNMLPVQIDVLYRTGLFAVAVSIASHALAAGSIASTILVLTGSRAGAIAGAALYAANPNVLYLQSTPMTEPLLFGLSTLQVCLFTRWVMSGTLRAPKAIGWVTVLVCLTRYEAWPITAVCFLTSAFAWWRRGHAWHRLAPEYARLAVYPVATVLLFMIFSRLTVGEWFVSRDFFVPDETLAGQPMVVLEKIAEGTSGLGGVWWFRLSLTALAVVSLLALTSPGRAPMAIALSLAAAAALPVSAYLSGHPFRIRYEVPLIVAGALLIGTAAGVSRRLAPALAGAALVLAMMEMGPFDSEALMLREAQIDQNAPARREVTACLKERFSGGPVMVSMGALGHYMQEMSTDGFAIRDFLHEGNGPLWDSAFTRGPAPLVEWVLMEEEAEGGDAIVQRFRRYPALLDGFDRICAGGGVALYQRDHRVQSQGSRTGFQ
jgi:hypothetical protein